MTHNAYFRLATTLTGMNVVDTYRLARFHSILPASKFKVIDIDRGHKQDVDIDGDGDYTMRKFAGVLSKQLLIMSDSLSDKHGNEDDRKRPADDSHTADSRTINTGSERKQQQSRGRRQKVAKKQQEFSTIINAARYIDNAEENDIENERQFLENANNNRDEHINRNIMYWADESQETNVSSVTCPLTTSTQDGVKASGSSESSGARNSSNISEDQRVVKVFWDRDRNPHTVVTLGRTTSKGNATYNKNYIMPKLCTICNERARTMCLECHEVFCYPLRTKRGNREVDRNDCCFAHHVSQCGEDGIKMY